MRNSINNPNSIDSETDLTSSVNEKLETDLELMPQPQSSKEENPTPQSQFPIDLNYEPQPNSFEWWWDDSTHSNYYENEDESNQYNTLDELLLNEESYFPSESNNNNLTDSENDQNPSANEKL